MRHNFTSWTLLLAAVQCANAASAPGTENQSNAPPLGAAHPLEKESFFPTMQRLMAYKPSIERKNLLEHWLDKHTVKKLVSVSATTTLSSEVYSRALNARIQTVNPCPQSLVLWTLQEYCRSTKANEEDAIKELAKYEDGLEYAFGYSWITHCVAADVLIKHCKEKPVTQIALFLAQKDEQNHLPTWRGRFAIARRLLDSRQYTEFKQWYKSCNKNVITAAIVKRYANTELISVPKLLAFTPLDVVEDAYTHSPEVSRTAAMNMMYVYKSSLDGIEQHEQPNQIVAFNLDLLNKDSDAPEYYPVLIEGMIHAQDKKTMAKQFQFLRTLHHDGVTDIAASAYVALIISSGQGLAPATCFNCVLALMDSSLSNSDFAALGCLSAANAFDNTALKILQSSDCLPLDVHPDTSITFYNSAKNLVSFNASQLVSTMISFNQMRALNADYACFFKRGCAMQTYIDGVVQSFSALKGCKFFSAAGIDVAMHRVYASHYSILRTMTNQKEIVLSNLNFMNATAKYNILEKFYFDHDSIAAMTMSVFLIVIVMFTASPSYLALIHHSVESMGRLPYTEEEVGLLEPAFTFIMDALNDANADVDWIRMMRVCLEITKRTIPELANNIKDVKPDRATETYEDIRALADEYLAFNIYELYKRQMPYLYIE